MQNDWTTESRRLIQQTLLGEAWDHAEEAVIVFDDDRNILAYNAAYCRLIGYTDDQLAGLARGGSLVIDAQSFSTFEQLLDADLPATGSAALRRGDGTEIAVGYRLLRTTAANMPCFLGVVWEVKPDVHRRNAAARRHAHDLADQARAVKAESRAYLKRTRDLLDT